MLQTPAHWGFQWHASDHSYRGKVRACYLQDIAKFKSQLGNTIEQPKTIIGKHKCYKITILGSQAFQGKLFTKKLI